MNTFFTADTHFGHTNIIKYCGRPYVSAEEMDAVLIANWNKVVAPEDTVFHLGDFCFGEPTRYLSRLNGYIKFVPGNHDKPMRELPLTNSRLEFLPTLAEQVVNDQRVVLCHYAMRVWNRSHHGSWQLYGHSHGTLPDDPYARALDVGVDCHNYFPVSFADVGKLMAKKSWIPLDHHGEPQVGGGAGLTREEFAKVERQRQYRMLKTEFEP